jgi:ER lumen protein retaining receptor
MKITFISVTLYILYLLRFHPLIKNTYNRETDDTFQHIYLIPICVVATLLIHTEFKAWEMTWSFSLWLEAVAIIPQIDILNKQKAVEKFTAHYIAALGSYRFFYILNWIYRYYYESYLCWTSIITGIVQVLLYADFLYLYLKK